MSAKEKYPNDPDRGMNTRLYLAAVFVALIAIIIIAYFLLASTGTKKIPKANQPNPNSRLVTPAESPAQLA